MEQNHLDITEIARKQRHVYLLSKVKQGKQLNPAEIKELEKYEVMTKRKENPQKAGRKSKYDQTMDKAANVLAGKGFTDKELATFFNVDEKTLNNWKKHFPLFFQSLKTGKAMADAQVEAALYQRAIGYSIPDVHISSYEGDITVTPIVKHFAPDITACIFWLKNRKPKKWRDKQELGVSDETPPQNRQIAVSALPLEMRKAILNQMRQAKPAKSKEVPKDGTGSSRT